MNQLRLLLLPLCALAMAGCQVGPSYQRPPVQATGAAPAAFTDLVVTNHDTVVWKVATPAADQPRGEWWRLFQDVQLNSLEALAATNNQNLAAAAARLDQARDLAAAARAEYYPTLTAGGTPGGEVSRQRTSAAAPVSGHEAGVTHTYNTFTAPLYLGWEPDLWGRLRNQSGAARARYAAAADDLASARLALAAETAADYFTLRALDNQRNLLADTIATYQRSLALVQNRRRGGVVTDLDVAQAATQLHSAEARLPVIELAREQLQNALALLCGQPPMNFAVATNTFAPAAFPVVPASLPGELLEHRPDIAAAERRMAAANASVGVAKTAFFPTVRINGVAGFQSVDAATWFDWPNHFWSVGPSVTLPIFTGGLNRANLAAARDAYNEAVANYRQTVLTAFTQVQDALAAEHWLAEQWSAEQAALASSQKALVIANNRYHAGLVIYLDVAAAQNDALTHESTLVQLSGARFVATINLVKALGAGWESAN